MPIPGIYGSLSFKQRLHRYLSIGQLLPVCVIRKPIGSNKSKQQRFSGIGLFAESSPPLSG